MTHETMKKVPSYLKGLIATRARADALAQRLEAVVREVQEQLTEAQRDRDSCDNLIRTYSPALNPASITPVRAWRGKYGKRGELTAAILEFVRSAYPSAVTTSEVGWHLVLKFEMDFMNSQARDNWRRTSVRNPLRALALQGQIDRLDVEGLDGLQAANWRWRPEVADAPSLVELAAGAQAEGIEVQPGTTQTANDCGLTKMSTARPEGVGQW